MLRLGSMVVAPGIGSILRCVDGGFGRDEGWYDCAAEWYEEPPDAAVVVYVSPTLESLPTPGAVEAGGDCDDCQPFIQSLMKAPWYVNCDSTSPNTPSPTDERPVEDYEALAADLLDAEIPVSAIGDALELRDRTIGDLREALGDIARLVDLPEGAEPDAVIEGVEKLYRDRGDQVVAFGFTSDENKRLRGEIEALRAESDNGLAARVTRLIEDVSQLPEDGRDRILALPAWGSIVSALTPASTEPK